MVVGTLRLSLLLRGSHSLKDKRRVVRGLKDRIRARFNVSIAEVDSQDSHQRAEIGVAMVSNDSVHVTTVFDKLVDRVRFVRGAELLDYDVEIL
ncbi:MAG: DUF503 domain-containing protein [Planctomycetes bacterium]|nr:DUF503 domain-containing protein [Planctomycetota bacterium]